MLNKNCPVWISSVFLVLISAAAGWAVYRFCSNQWSDEIMACVQDAKLCSDGSSVVRVLPNCDFAACPKESLIKVESPRAYETIKSPLTIKGWARGGWFFEASFPVKLFDGNGELLAATVAQAQDDWMTENFVSFQAVLNFKTPATQTGVLILEKDNPSGLTENDDQLAVPVGFMSASKTKTKTINLYYYNPEEDRDEAGNIQCGRGGLAAVKREMPLSQTPIQDAIKLMLKGDLTEKEIKRGITTEYPLAGFSLRSASLRDGVLTLDFDDSLNKTAGGSCRVGVLWFQIEATAKQFPEVQEVRFQPEELFQP